MNSSTITLILAAALVLGTIAALVSQESKNTIRACIRFTIVTTISAIIFSIPMIILYSGYCALTA